MSKKCVKKVKIQIYHIPNVKEASKYPFSNNNGSPTRGQKMGGNGGNRGKIGERFAWHANVLSRFCLRKWVGAYSFEKNRQRLRHWIESMRALSKQIEIQESGARSAHLLLSGIGGLTHTTRLLSPSRGGWVVGKGCIDAPPLALSLGSSFLESVHRLLPKSLERWPPVWM